MHTQCHCPSLLLKANTLPSLLTSAILFGAPCAVLAFDKGTMQKALMVAMSFFIHLR